MREIKFRAWDKQEKIMIATGFHVFGEVHAFGAIEAHCYETKNDKHGLERLNDIVVMQYTGMKDKNGREIYEGDIVHISGYVNWFTHTVVFVDGCFRCSSNSEEDSYLTDFVPRSPNCEIVGNIHENHELLNQGV